MRLYLILAALFYLTWDYFWVQCLAAGLIFYQILPNFEAITFILIVGYVTMEGVPHFLQGTLEFGYQILKLVLQK